MLVGLAVGLLLGLLASSIVRLLPGWLLRQHGQGEAIAVPCYGLREILIIGLASALTCLSYVRYGLTLEYLAISGLFFMLLTLAWIDHTTHLLPDILTLPLLWAGLLANSFALFSTPSSAIQGAVTGYCTLWLLARVHLLATRRLGMAHGDYKLAAALGAWFGLPALSTLLLLAVAFGLLAALLRGLLHAGANRQPQPFGPCLVLAAAVFVFTPSTWHL